MSVKANRNPGKKTKQKHSGKAEGRKPNKVVVGQPLHYNTAPHPPRVNSPEYNGTRKWLMGRTPGGCFICGGPVDLSHPTAPEDSKKLRLEDHHGGGLYHDLVLIGFNLFPLEWATGWGAAPKKVADFVAQLRVAGLCTYKEPINTVQDVMKWVDSQFNANVKLCKPHHVGVQTQHTPDVNGHEAVGIHNAPWPVLAAQATCDWNNFNMFAGTTGTLAVSPDPTTYGGVIVTYVHDSHPETVSALEVSAKEAGALRPVSSKLQIGTKLGPSHPSAIAAFNGYKSIFPSIEAVSVDDYKLSVLLPNVKATFEKSKRTR
jgi:hypothetical protein